MNVFLDKDVLLNYGSPQVSSDDFDELLGFDNRRCRILTIQQIDSNTLASLNHIDRMRFLTILERNNNVQYLERKSDCFVTLDGESELTDRIFSLHEVCEYVSFGARIVLEDATNDGSFIKAIERNFENTLDFDYLLSRDVVEIDNAGGSGTKRRVEEFINTHHGKPKFLRCLVIVDGDCRFPGDTDFENYKKQKDEKKFFEERGVGYYILKKRTQENYMPDEVFDSNRNLFGNEWVDAYLSLNPEQKDYYYIAEGFSKDIPKAYKDVGVLGFDKLPQKMQDLFWNVSPGNYQHLLHKPNLHGSFKSEFPKFFNNPHVYKASFMTRVGHPRSTDPDELMHIVEKIRQLL